MNRILFSSLRAHMGRLLATGLAVTLSTAFVVTTLLLLGSYNATMVAGLTAQMNKADVQIAITDVNAQIEAVDQQIDAAVEGLHGLDEVEAVDVQRNAPVQVAVAERRANANVEPLLSAGNRWQELAVGRWPAAPAEAVIDEAGAKNLGVAIGDSLTVTSMLGESEPVVLTLVGLSSTGNLGFNHGVPTLVTSKETFNGLHLPAVTTGILVSAHDKLPPEVLAARISEDVSVGSALSIFTREQAVQQQLAQLSGSSTILTGLLLAFGAIALLVSGFVIANTFRVLVAQRTNELALLRCIGAGVRDIYRLILMEAGLVGLVFAVVGATMGVGIAAGFVSYSKSSGSGLPLTEFSLSPMTILGTIAMGTIATIIFAVGPARSAAKVHPLVALREAQATPTNKGSTKRAMVGALLIALGAAGMWFAASRGSLTVALCGGVLAGLGVLILSSILLPVVVSLLGQVFSRMSVSTQLAAANAYRHRRHTAATGSALLIGSILLAMLTTGVNSARESITAQIDDRRPIDLIVEVAPGQTIDPATVAAIKAVPGVVASSEILTGTVTIEGVWLDGFQAAAEGMDQKSIEKVAHAKVALPVAGTIHLSPEDPAASQEGQSVTAYGNAGAATLQVVVDDVVPPGTVRVASSDLLAITENPGVARLFLRLDGALGSPEIHKVMTDIQSFDEGIMVSGGAQERAFYHQILGTMLMVVLALLAVAVIIAFVGIGNTAALSVIERRRESALLRIVGLSRGQLVGMICTEAALTAVVATALGLIIGVLFGWAGIATIGQAASEIEMALYVPWRQLAAILVGAIVAGLLAALAPACAASRRRPVVDLAPGR